MTRAIGAFVVLCVIFGTTFAAIAVGIGHGWPSLLAAGVRFSVAGVIVLTVAALRGEVRRPTRRLALQIAFIGLTVTTATFGALYTAERAVPSGLAAVVSATGPAFAVAIALVAGRRRFDLALGSGLVIGTAGVALVVGVGELAIGPAAALGALAIIISEFAFASGLTMTRAIAGQLPVLMIAGAQQLIGGAVLLVLSAIFEHALPAQLGDPVGWIALVYLIVVASAGAHTLAIWLASRTSATFAASWTYVSPFIALSIGSLALHEPLPLTAWLGAVLVIAGAALVNLDLRASLRTQVRRV